MEDIVFVGGARDYHLMHRYRVVRALSGRKNVAVVTDLIESEGFEKLVGTGDRIIPLFIVDRMLFRRQTVYGNLWRNLVKLGMAPLQVVRLRSIARRNPRAVFHANPMYYMFLCWLARIPYIGTPQGSEILVRCDRSRLYRYFAVKCLRAARHVTVDSVNMRDKIREISGKKAIVLQNGIDVSTILSVAKRTTKRDNVVSIRGIASLYRIDRIIQARHLCSRHTPLHFIYPFAESRYKLEIEKGFELEDVDLGRLTKPKMYELLASSKLAISIPASDSSPRSVYEAIFAGCCVAVTYNPWIDAIPECMRARLYVVDLEDKLWFEKAVQYADSLTAVPYEPSEAALTMFDERRAMKELADMLY